MSARPPSPVVGNTNAPGSALGLAPGAQVILLGHLGKWAHVETMHKGKLTRGFVMDFTLADAAWRDESKPFDLRAASWAPMARWWPTC